jgi:hypothetical protein
MKKLYISILLSVSIFSISCNSSKNKNDTDPITNTPPPRIPPQIDTAPGVKAGTALPSTLPSKITIKELESRTLFSFYANKFDNFWISFFDKGIHDKSSFLDVNQKRKTNAIIATIKRHLSKTARRAIKEVSKKTFPSIVNNVNIKGGILIWFASRQNNPKDLDKLIYFHASDIVALKKRLNRGEFGMFKTSAWGGMISVKNSIGTAQKENIYINIEGDGVLISNNMELLSSGMKVANRIYSGSINTNMGISATNLTTFLPGLKHLFRELFYPFNRLAYSLGKSTKWISMVVGKNQKSGNYNFDSFIKYNPSPKSYFAKEALTKKDVTPLGKYIHKDSIFFMLDGTNKLPLKKKLTKYLKVLTNLESGIKNKKKKKMVKWVVKQGNSSEKILNSWTEYIGFGLRLIKNKLAARIIIPLQKDSNEKELYKTLYSLTKNLKPKSFLKLATKRERKEIKSLLKFLKVKIAKKKVGKDKAIVVSLKFNWKKVPYALFDMKRSEAEIVKSIVGKRLEIAFIFKNKNMIISIAGKNSINELKDSISLKGVIPGNHKLNKTISYSLLSGINGVEVLNKITRETSAIGVIKNFPAVIKAMATSRKYLAPYSKTSWSFFSMGLNKTKVSINSLIINSDSTRIPSVLVFLGETAWTSGALR